MNDTSASIRQSIVEAGRPWLDARAEFSGRPFLDTSTSTNPITIGNITGGTETITLRQGLLSQVENDGIQTTYSTLTTDSVRTAMSDAFFGSNTSEDGTTIRWMTPTWYGTNEPDTQRQWNTNNFHFYSTAFETHYRSVQERVNELLEEKPKETSNFLRSIKIV